MELIEKMTASELVYDGKVVHLYKDTVELPDGASSIREYVKHMGAVCVIPITDEGEVLLERQYRYAVGQILTEIPAGKLADLFFCVRRGNGKGFYIFIGISEK